jgi:hypothetical protein
MDVSTTLLSILAALGLAAACGFRVFVPLLLVSLAARSGHLELSQGFAWIGSTPALICFGTATVLEVLAYYVPVVDNFLDSVATPAAIVAGVVVSAAVMTDIEPWLKWSLATVAGGGLAAERPARGSGGGYRPQRTLLAPSAPALPEGKADLSRVLGHPLPRMRRSRA